MLISAHDDLYLAVFVDSTEAWRQPIKTQTVFDFMPRSEVHLLENLEPWWLSSGLESVLLHGRVFILNAVFFKEAVL